MNCDLADGDDRRKQVTTWLAQIALDAGLLGMEQPLGLIAATHEPAVRHEHPGA